MKNPCYIFFLILLIHTSCHAQPNQSDHECFVPALIPFRVGKGENAKWGYCNADKKILIPAIYSSVRVFKNGTAIVAMEDKYMLIDTTGKPLSEKYDFIFDENGYYKVTDHSGKYGLLNSKGKLALPIMYDLIMNYSYTYNGNYVRSDSMVYVILNRDLGIYTTSGKEIMPPKYFRLSRVDDVYIVQENHQRSTEILDMQGNVLYSKTGDAYEINYQNRNLAVVMQSTGNGLMYGLINLKGEVLVPFKYNYISDFRNGLAEVYIQESNHFRHGFIDSTGKEVVPLIYDRVRSYQNGLNAVMKNGNIYVIDQFGNRVYHLGSGYSDLGNFSDGKVIACKNDHAFVLDTRGNVVPFQYHCNTYFQDGMSIVFQMVQPAITGGPGPFGYWSIIDTTGKVLMQTYGGEICHGEMETYRDAIAGKIWSVQLKKPAIPEMEAKAIDDLYLKELEEFNGLRILAGSKMDSLSLTFTMQFGDKYGLVDTSGNWIIPPIYESIEHYQYGQPDGNWLCIKHNNKFGYMDRKGNIVIPFKYESATPFAYQGLAIVYIDGQFTYIDGNGIEYYK